MDISSSKSVSSSDVTQTSSLSAKLKRLQIEESLLLQSVNKKCVPEVAQMDGGAGVIADATSYQTFSEFKAFLGKTKNSFREIKLLYQDLRTSTSSKETLKTLDMDELKKITLELENRMKAFKMYLQTELICLKSTEEQLNHAINENPVSINNLKRQPRIQTAKYNEIVPSPVKTMMTSPFKCSEVQQFQEFMKNSANRYGGWNEYHHNIFVHHWKKHFGFQIDNSFDGTDNSVETSPAFDTFLYDLVPKLLDIREEEIISHVKWYSKYLYLKGRQQKAIDKWRSNRRVMKSAQVQAEAEPRKEGSIRKKSSGRKTISNCLKLSKTGKPYGYKTNQHLVSDQEEKDELDFMTDLVPKSQNQDKVRFTRKCYSESMQRGIDLNSDVYNSLSNVENLTPKDCENSSGSDQTLLHFQKPTKQWCLMTSSKDNKIETNVNNVESIKKLRIPAWRVGL